MSVKKNLKITLTILKLEKTEHFFLIRQFGQMRDSIIFQRLPDNKGSSKNLNRASKGRHTKKMSIFLVVESLRLGVQGVYPPPPPKHRGVIFYAPKWSDH